MKMYLVNKFDKSFSAHRLSNWEVPKWYPQRPRQRTGSTKVISDDRGHLLPSVPRPKSSPWGDFKNTWQLPDKISKNQIEEINAPLIGKNKWSKYKFSKDSCECIDNQEPKKHTSRQSRKQKFQEKLQKSQSLDFEYTPGDLTKPEEQHKSRELLLQQKHYRDHGKTPDIDDSNELYLEKHQCNDEISLLREQEQIENQNQQHILGEDVESNLDKIKLSMKPIPEKPNQRSPSPIIPAKYNFQMAKKMFAENLEHQPLPDCIADQAFRKLQAEGHNYPGLALDIAAAASGVGVRTYQAGPSHCTKMKVFRPKTCGILPKPLRSGTKTPTAGSHRPGTSVIDKKMGQMDLAICWDFRPANPLDEPKRARHIDGTEDDAGPAVFQMVTTPRSIEKIDTGRSGGVFTNTFGEVGFFDKDILMKKTDFARSKSDLKCTCGTSPINVETNLPEVHSNRAKSLSRNSSAFSDKRKRYKSSPNLSQFDISEFKENKNDYNNLEYLAKLNQRTRQHTCSKYRAKDVEVNPPKQPSFFQKTMRMCYKVAPQPYPEEREKERFKSAFKAGAPVRDVTGAISSDSGCSTMSSTCSSKILVVPKPRNPYIKKKYDIDTLVPPFTCYKGGAGQGGYPEHWRLATVYQHTYKPIEQRKKPLIETVFK